MDKYRVLVWIRRGYDVNFVYKAFNIEAENKENARMIAEERLDDYLKSRGALLEVKIS